jgi:hypothetical protein
LQIRELLQIVGMNPRELTLAAIGSDVLVGMSQGPLQTGQLQRAQLISTGALDLFKLGGFGAMLFSHTLIIALRRCAGQLATEGDGTGHNKTGHDTRRSAMPEQQPAPQLSYVGQPVNRETNVSIKRFAWCPSMTR